MVPNTACLVLLVCIAFMWLPFTAPAFMQSRLDKQIEEEVNALRPPEPDHVVSRKIMKNFLNCDDNAPRDTSAHRRRTRRSAEDPKYNVVYLIDSSNSLGKRNFSIALNALRILTLKSRPGTLFAAVTFSDAATVSFNFTTRKQAYRKLIQIPFIAGKTNTQAAIDLARRMLFNNPDAGATPGALRRVLVVTDGLSNLHRNLTLYNAYRLKIDGAEIYVVAVGQYLYGLHELVGMASSTEQHLFRAQSMEGLEGAVKMIPDSRRFNRKKVLKWQKEEFGNDHASNLKITGLKL